MNTRLNLRPCSLSSWTSCRTTDSRGSSTGMAAITGSIPPLSCGEQYRSMAFAQSDLRSRVLPARHRDLPLGHAFETQRDHMGFRQPVRARRWRCQRKARLELSFLGRCSPMDSGSSGTLGRPRSYIDEDWGWT